MLLKFLYQSSDMNGTRKAAGFGELIMNEMLDCGKEKRLQYHWPVWFGADYNDILSQGQMVDISSQDATFTCYADTCPQPGENISTRFSVPRYDSDGSFDMESFIRAGHIYRVEELSPFLRRVAIQFAEHLPFRPGEFSSIQSQVRHTNENLAATEAKAFAESTSEPIESVVQEFVGVKDAPEAIEAQAFTDEVERNSESVGI